MQKTLKNPSLNNAYCGRFAPSPSGKLHFGSLVTALASYLDAKFNQGRWLVRIEDLDPPREEAGASKAILSSLEAHHLHWDGEVVYQSHRYDLYENHLEILTKKSRTFRCNCTRQRLQELDNRYDGYCLRHPPPTQSPSAIKFVPERSEIVAINDLIQGRLETVVSNPEDVFVLKRKDNLYAYQLAVVCDDIEQGISHIVRGCDLLSTTANQILLYQSFNAIAPTFGHLPVVLGDNQQKLSKQNKAKPINDQHALKNIHQALDFLRQEPPDIKELNSVEELLRWAVKHWALNKIPQQEGMMFEPTL